ncbi:MAG: DUF448 domain-containing protein [Sphingomonadaceae bacterium]|nr:DUF448 domain-containing protein [Sphingomonadaceae bacterium]
MRNPRNDGLAFDTAADAQPHVPERQCILTRDRAPREALVRLALSPEGEVLPDVRAKAPGRGAWIGVDRAALEAAIAKGKLRGALSRAFKTGEIVIPDDLPARVEAALERAALDRLGLEARGGALITGSEKIRDAAMKGGVKLLLHAADASEDGRRKLDQAWRVGLDEEGSARRGLVVPAGRAILSPALGRDNVVHIAVVDAEAAKRVSGALARWTHFLGLNDRNGSRGDAPREPGRVEALDEGQA